MDEAPEQQEATQTEKTWQVVMRSGKFPKFVRRYAVDHPPVTVYLVKEEIEGMSEGEINRYVVDKFLATNNTRIVRLWVDPETGQF